MDLKERENQINLIKLLTLIGESDGKIQPFEDRFVREIANKAGIDDDELILIKATAVKDNIEFPEDEKDRMIQFYHSLIMMKIDTEIKDSEIAIIKELGEYFQFNPLMVDDLIELMRKYRKGVIPNKELIDIVTKY